MLPFCFAEEFSGADETPSKISEAAGGADSWADTDEESELEFKKVGSSSLWQGGKQTYMMYLPHKCIKNHIWRYNIWRYNCKCPGVFYSQITLQASIKNEVSLKIVHILSSEDKMCTIFSEV